MYLVFKENIQIATLLKRGNKNVDIKFSAHERFWNNLHQVAQDQKIGKPNNLIVLGAQNLWVLMLCMSFFYTWWRYWECCFYDVGFGAVGDVVLRFYGEYCWGCWIFALCQLWSVHRSSLVWHLFCLYLRILYITASFITYCLRFWPRYSFSGNWFMSSDAEKLAL